MATFSQYYEEALRRLNQGQSQPPSAPSERAPLYPTDAAPAEPENSNPDFFKDPIGATFDFLARGLYGSTNVVSKAVDTTIEGARKLERGDVAGALFDALTKNPLLATAPGFNPSQINTIRDFSEGVSTSDAEKKRFYSEVIEETTDKIGKATDPNYIDRVDNVAGPLKGSLGLAADLTLDPTMYVPIPVGAVVRGAKSAVKGVRGLASGGKSAEQTAEALVPEAGAIAEAGEKVTVPAAPRVTPREAMSIPMPESQTLPTSSPTGARAPDLPNRPAPRTLDDLDEITADYEDFINTPSPGLAAAEDTIARVEAMLSAQKLAEATPVAPTAAKVDDALGKVDAAPKAAEAPAVAQGVAQAEKTRPASILERFQNLPKSFEVPGLKGKVTAQYAQDAFLAISTGKRTGPRQKAVYEWVVSRSEEPPTPTAKPAPEVAAASPVEAPSAPRRFETPRDEARWMWAHLEGEGHAVRTENGDIPINRRMLEQALELEAKSELPDGWADNLAILRADADANERFRIAPSTEPVGPPVGKTPEEREAIRETAKFSDENDEAAKWLAENDQSLSPETVQHAVKIQGQAEATLYTPTGASVSDVLLAMTPGQIIATSKQAERMRGLLDTLEYMVKEGKAGGGQARVPIIPQRALGDYDPGVVRAFLSSKEAMVLGGAERLVENPELLNRAVQNWVITNYVASFDYWAYHGLDDLADAKRRVTVTLPSSGREIKVDTDDIKDWLDEISMGSEIKPEQFEILQAVDNLFREEIVAGNVMNPAREAVEIHNVVDAWQYLVREKNEWLQGHMGEIAYEFLTDSKIKPAQLAARFQVMRDLLTPDYSIDVLENLRELDRLQRPTLNAVARELNFEPQMKEMLNPSPKAVEEPSPQYATVEERDADLAQQALEAENPEYFSPMALTTPDPTPTTPHKEAEGKAPELVDEVVSQPSTITPTPSTPAEVEQIVQALSKDVPTEGTASPDVMVALVGDVIADVTKRTILDVPKVAPYRTPTGAYRTHPEQGEGFGWHLKKWNTQNQYATEAGFNRRLNDVVAKVFKAQGKRSKDLSTSFSKSRSRTVERLWIDFHDLLDKALNKIGVKQVIGYGEDLIPLSFGDIYRAVGNSIKSQIGEDIRLLLFQNGQTRVNWTNLADAVHIMLRGGSDDEMAVALMNNLKPGAKGTVKGETMPNNFAEKGMRKGFHLTLGQREKWYRKNLMDTFPGADVKNTTGGMHQVLIPGTALTDVMVGLLRNAQDDLAKTAVNNGWRMAERGATEAYDLAAPVLQRLDELHADPTARAAFIEELAGVPETIAKTATEKGAYKESADTASTIVRTTVGDSTVIDAEQLAEINRIVNQKAIEAPKGSTPKKVGTTIDNSSRARAKAVMDEAEEVIDAERIKQMHEANIEPRMMGDDVEDGIEAARQGAEILDLAAPYQAEVATGFNRFLNWGRETFKVDYQHERLWDLTHNAALQAQDFLRITSNRLAALSRKHPKEELAQAWQQIQLGVKGTSEVQKTLESLVSRLWDPSNDSLFADIFLNTEKNLDYVNSIIAMEFKGSRGFVPEFDLGLAKNRSIQEHGTADLYHRYLGEQWRGWQIDDPADFLVRMTKAATTVALRKSTVENFVARAKRWGAMSTTPKPGYVLLPHTDNNSAFSVFLPQEINGKPVYWEKELARELHRADILTHTSRRMTGEIGDAVNKYFMPMQDSWKISMTIYRIGHHVRNFIGDASVTWVVRGNRAYMRSYKDALKVLGMRNDYKDADIVRAIRYIEEDGAALPFNKGDVVVRGTFGDKEIELTAGQILDLTYRKGLRPTFHLGEGLYDDAILQSQWSKFWRKISLQDTKFNEIAGGVSQYRDHLARAQHFIQILHQELGPGGVFTGKQFKAKTLDELFDLAAAEVKKYHPDASMLTPRESKYGRVFIPFYSWFAKMLPNVLMLTVTRPGRVAAFPKASYELAVMNGVNPDSMADPFPEDQLFPSFLTEKALGPQFTGASFPLNMMGVDPTHYFGVNPGIAHLDVFNTVGPDPVRGILGMTTPILRVPFEALAGGTLGTGARINDTSDFVDESIPGVNYLSDIMGVSVTGTLGSVLSGQPGLDPQFQVRRGNKEGFGSGDAMMSLFNYLTGLGVQDMSRPNYINYAELERKRGEVPTE